VQDLYAVSNDVGIASRGSSDTLIDDTRHWQDDILKGVLLRIEKEQQVYERIVLSNTYNTITFSPLPTGVEVKRGDRWSISGLLRGTATLLQFSDGTLITNPRFSKKIYEGYGFSISHRFEDVAADGVVEVYFENPSASDRTIFIIAIECTSFAQAWVDLYRDALVTLSGTELAPINLNQGSDITSVVNVEYGGTYDISGAQLVHNTVVPGGSKIRAVGGLAEVGEAVAIPEEYSFLIRFTNKSASATDMSVRIIWWEEV